MSTTRVPKADITGLYGAVVRRLSKKLLGRVPEPLGVYWHNRAVLKATMGLGAKAERWNACDLSLKTFAQMARLGADRLRLVSGFRLLPGVQRAPRYGQGP